MQPPDHLVTYSYYFLATSGVGQASIQPLLIVKSMVFPLNLMAAAFYSVDPLAAAQTFHASYTVSFSPNLK